MSVRVAAVSVLLLGTLSLGAGVWGLARTGHAMDPEAPLAAHLTVAASAKPEKKLKHEWHLYAGHHWQIVGAATETREQTDKREGNRGACAAGMVEVKGKMRVDPPGVGPYDAGAVEQKQKSFCTKWINKDFPERCATFDKAKWEEHRKTYPTVDKHFCIDRFEFPNQKGAHPIIMVTWPESKALCEADGKRLCNEDEWTFACEGEDTLPYPYGYDRDATACISDQTWKVYSAANFSPREAEAAKWEMDKLWQGFASGAQPRCKSPFGVYDMTGNVDEWTLGTRAGDKQTILKGGYWGPVRTRCRPTTRSHDHTHSFYQQGFRCCADVPKEKPTGDKVDAAAAPLPREAR